MAGAVAPNGSWAVRWSLPQFLRVLLLRDAWYRLNGGPVHNQPLSARVLGIGIRNLRAVEDPVTTLSQAADRHAKERLQSPA